MENKKATIEIDGVMYNVTIHDKVEQLKVKRWRAEKGESYYFTEPSGTVCSSEDNHKVDNFRFETGNYFQSKEEAEKHLKYLTTRQRVKDAIAELNNGWVPDWKRDSQEKVIIRYVHKYNRLVAILYRECQYFEDWKVIQSVSAFNQLREIFTDEELKLALFEIHE